MFQKMPHTLIHDAHDIVKENFNHFTHLSIGGITDKYFCEVKRQISLISDKLVEI